MFVRVNVLSQFVMSYIVELDDDSPPEYAADIVVMDEHEGKLKEFSQRHLGYTYLDYHRIESDDLIPLCKEENEYCESWSDDVIVHNFVNKMDD